MAAPAGDLLDATASAAVVASQIAPHLLFQAWMALDFGSLPPEINSNRMYAGPGSGPLMAAATAWDELAAELSFVARTYSSVIAELTSLWIGPTAASMIAAVTPYVSWLGATAVQAEQAGAQARAASAAYEAAFAMTVPPQLVEANRELLMVLIATNFFGQNTPAIATTEAQYAEMWAQDAAAMYGYAAASAAASQLTPFGLPPNTTNQAGVAKQTEANMRSETSKRVLTSIASWLSGHKPHLTPAELNAMVNLYSTFMYDFAGLTMNAGQVAQAFLHVPAQTGAEGVGIAAAESGLARLGLAGLPVSASIGQASKIGALSTPPTWATLTSAQSAEMTVPEIANAPRAVFHAAAGGETSALLRGVPTSGGPRTANFSQRRYGLRLNVTARPPAGG